MADEGTALTTLKKEDQTALSKIPPNELSMLSADLCDGDVHVGVSVKFEADGKISTLMIPDATKITKGKPVYLTSKITLVGKNLLDFLQAKNVPVPEAVEGLLKTLSVSCDAFYFSSNKVRYTLPTDEAKVKEKLGAAFDEWKKNNATGGEVDEGAILLMFTVDTGASGLIASLTNDPALGKLFDIKGASLRVVRGIPASAGELEAYARLLQAS